MSDYDPNVIDGNVTYLRDIPVTATDNDYSSIYDRLSEIVEIESGDAAGNPIPVGKQVR